MSAADAVFLATVASISDAPLDHLSPGGEPIDGRLVRLRVLARWKGDLEDSVGVFTGFSDADCGFPFVIGDTYLVYASGPPESLHTSICSRTARASAAVDDLIALGAARDPRPAAM